MLQETVRIAKTAAKMDDTHVFALAGSTAVHLFLTELLKHSLNPADKEEGERLLGSLAPPDDLDFKYKRYGPIFAEHIVNHAQATSQSTGLTLDFSFLQESNPETCQTYVDLAGFRSCDPYEESPIFQKLPGTASIFSKLEFHAPKEFRRKPMNTVDLAGISVLNVDDMIALYTNHQEEGQLAANAPKRAVLAFVQDMYQKYPTTIPPPYSSSET